MAAEDAVIAGHVTLFEDVITDHLLLLILQFLPCNDLARSASLVTRRWRQACASPALWRLRLPGPLGDACAGSSWYGSSEGPRRLYWAVYRFNLLLNPSLQLSQQFPNRISSGRDTPGRGRTPWFSLDSWQWEGSSPGGLPPAQEQPLLPPPPLPQYSPQGAVRHPVGVLTSPNTWSAMMQVVDLPRELQRRGVPLEAATAFLGGCPPLELSLWHAGHEQGRARCEVWLAVDDGTADISSWLQATDLTSGRYSAVATTGVTPCPRGKWAQARLTLHGYPRDCRRAFVVLKGEGNTALLGQNVGFWGAKFASPTLRLLPPDEVAG